MTVAQGTYIKPFIRTNANTASDFSFLYTNKKTNVLRGIYFKHTNTLTHVYKLAIISKQI